MMQSRMRTKRPDMGSSQRVQVRRGQARVWFYRNDGSIDVYVRPASEGNDKPAPISFRISARDFVGR